MDVPRIGVAHRRRVRQAIAGAFAALLIPLITYAVARLRPAAPEVERSVVWIGTVRRGPMVRAVRGLGTLIPEESLIVPAPMDGRIRRILVRAGSPVQPDALIAELTNPELDASVADAEYVIKTAESALMDLRAQLDNRIIDQKVAAAQIAVEYTEAKLIAERDEKLPAAALQQKISRAKADQLAVRERLEKERAEVIRKSAAAQIAAQEARVAQARAQCELKRRQVDALKVRSGIDGILQQVLVEVGQKVPAGTSIAKVVQPSKLKAEIKIPEMQAKDIQIGQRAEIDTRNGIIPGHVARIDPAVFQGTVTIDVKLDGPLPQGTRPDLSVDGTVELERLASVVYLDRPVSGQPHSTITLFKLIDGGKGAARVEVRLGRASVDTIEVLGGLQVGDSAILSDTSAWDNYDRVRLN
jgi:HlyD family secretion protein